MAKEPKTEMPWEHLIEDDDWLNEEKGDEGDSWMEEAKKVQGNWKSWRGDPKEPPLKKRLAEWEALLKAERQAEAELIRKVRESRDSFLRQLDLSQRPEQLGWVTKRFQKMITQGEATADKMLHLRGNMIEALNQAMTMFYNALELARPRVKGAKSLKELEDETYRRIRERNKEANDYIRRLRKEARTCPRCKRDKPASHLYCWSCQEERRKPVLDPDDYCPECGKITSPKGTLCYSCSSLRPRVKKKRREDSCERCGTLISRRFGKFCWSCVNYYGL